MEVEKVECSRWNPYGDSFGGWWFDRLFSPLFCTPKYGKCAHSYKFFIRNFIVFRCGSTQQSQSAPYGFYIGIHMEDIRKELPVVPAGSSSVSNEYEILYEKLG
jgi:hypothetical protein